MRKKSLLIGGVALIIVAGITSYVLLSRPLKAVAPVERPKIAKPVPPAPPVVFNKAQYSLTDPASIWVVVNKKRPLGPMDYAPADLAVPKVAMRSGGMQVRQSTATALETMFAAAKRDGLDLKLSSAYRSYAYQVNLYNGYVQKQGQAVADSQSARPGYSEHQTGLAADIGPASGKCNLQQCFADTNEGKWLATNAYKYGFLIRYPNGLTPITGYTYEPWHVRYLGVELSTELHNAGVQTLEQYFELGPAADY